MTSDWWSEMADDEEAVANRLEILDVELGQVLLLPRVITTYDELRLAATGSFEAMLPHEMTERFVDDLSIDEHIALTEPMYVQAVVDALLSYLSAELRATMVAELTETANGLLSGVKAFFDGGGEVRIDRHGRIQVRKPRQDWPD